jgi:23S rRNA pseudouridine1911/1915/1917 synthase
MTLQPAESIEIVITPREAGFRIDKVLAQHQSLGSVSRSQIKKYHMSGHVLVNKLIRPLKYKVQAGDLIVVALPQAAELDMTPEDIPLDILFEDEHMIVINKQPGLVVHPAPGHMHSTLVHGLLFHCRDLSGIGGVLRPGIVHRLDKDTSGVLVAAKNDFAHQYLVKQFKDRQVEKSYLALLAGVPAQASGTITTMIGRHPVHRKKMAVLERAGRLAVSHWQILECFKKHCYVRVSIDTGRTHQIRVHMAHLGCPVLGDNVYGGKKTQCNLATRQCLHASVLSLTHPLTGDRMTFKAPLAEDIKEQLLDLQGEEGE